VCVVSDSGGTRRSTTHRSTHPQPSPSAATGTETAAALSGASLFVACAVTGIQIANPFENGVWLVAYLMLVGCAAQVLLGRGQTALTGSTVSPGTIYCQLALWNFGVVAVPLGVLTDTRLSVVLGAMGLLAALRSYWSVTCHAHRSSAPVPAGLRVGYLMLLALMVASVFIGTALAWDRPWL
jgi:hypothetical protein